MAIVNPASRWIYAVSFALGAAGFLMPFWPLSLMGIVLATLSGRWIFGLLMALLLDLAWGAPFGLAAYLYFPFTVAALVAAIARYFSASYFLERSTPDTL